MSTGPWYQDGLRFECTRCGACCTGFPGTVRVTAQEVDVLARRLGLSSAEFRNDYTRSVGGAHLSLRETEELDCVFYDHASGCQVYEDRPKQCRTWPFWGRVVRSPGSWAMDAETCPGMNYGPLHDADTVCRFSENDGTTLGSPDDGTAAASAHAEASAASATLKPSVAEDHADGSAQLHEE